MSVIVEGSVWVDRVPSVSGPHRDLYRRLVRVDAVSEGFVCGLSYWERRGTDPRDREWHRDRTSKGRPTRITRLVFERKFEPIDGGRTPEEMLREQIARDILDYAEQHADVHAGDAGDVFEVAARIARGEDPKCDCMDRGYAGG